MKPRVAYLDRVPAREGLQRRRQGLRRGHLSVCQKNRDDNGLLLEPGKNLQSYKIFWIVQSRDAAFVGNLDPFSTYEDEQDARFRHAVIDGIDKILSRLDSIDVHKNIMLAVF